MWTMYIVPFVICFIKFLLKKRRIQQILCLTITDSFYLTGDLIYVTFWTWNCGNYRSNEASLPRKATFTNLGFSSVSHHRWAETVFLCLIFSSFYGKVDLWLSPWSARERIFLNVGFASNYAYVCAVLPCYVWLHLGVSWTSTLCLSGCLIKVSHYYNLLCNMKLTLNYCFDMSCLAFYLWIKYELFYFKSSGYCINAEYISIFQKSVSEYFHFGISLHYIIKHVLYSFLLSIL